MYGEDGRFCKDIAGPAKKSALSNASAVFYRQEQPKLACERLQKGGSIRISTYVLVTPAHNEGAFIERTIQSVIAQTILPVRWVLVNDGSTDRTSEIMRKYLPANPWMEVIDRPRRSDRNFAGKAYAVNAAYQKVRDLDFEVFGNLDADSSLERDHFEFLLSKFSENPRLGVAGSAFREEDYSSLTDGFAGREHVSGQCQLFRRDCWEEIGGYFPHRAGGVDWIAVTTARMKGWQTESFKERSLWHHRRMGSARHGRIRFAFACGEKDYYLGNHPIWEIFRVGYRCMKTPYLAGGVSLGLGYCFAFLRRMPRAASPELVAFHRQEQMTKLVAILKSFAKRGRVDRFNVERE